MAPANAEPSIIRVILRDGQSLKVRPIAHEDKEKLKALFYRLSPQTRYLRFGYMKAYISDQELDYFTVVNPPDTYAYVALTGEGEEEQIVGVGRWFLSPDGRTAEIAFVVEDTIQVRGIGTALLEQLAEAAAKYRIKRFVARVLPENTRMLEVFEESGFSITKRIYEGAYELIFNLEEQEEYAKRQAYREHISSNDLLEFWEDDDNTRVILLYLETFGNPRRFSRIARRLTRKKPIIAVKAGRSEGGGRAATSHTGALAGSDIAVDALFRQAGVIRVNTIEEMFNAAKNLAHQPLPKGPRLAIITNAGGPGVLAVDAAVNYGLSVPPLSEETRQKLAQFLPKEASLVNPVDMIASATGEQFGTALSVILEDPSIDAAIVINIPVRPYQEVASGIQHELAGYKGDKPVVACFMMSGTNTVEIRTAPDRLVPVYMFPEDAVQAFFHSYTYSRYRTLKAGSVPVFPDADEERARKYLESSPVLKNGGWLPSETALGLLKEYGIPAAGTRTAFSAEEAAKAALEIGFPVVMKLRSKTITHKTDVHGVLIGLKSEDEVIQGYNEMKTRLESAGQAGQMEGVILQPFVKGGVEVILGMSLDPVFGPLVMVGLGGIHVELMKDVAFSIHPLTDIDPDYMFSQLKGLPLLTGWRGSPPKDIDALREALLRFSALIEDIPEIAAVEINPLMVFDQGKGAMAVDARILFKPAAITL